MTLYVHYTCVSLKDSSGSLKYLSDLLNDTLVIRGSNEHHISLTRLCLPLSFKVLLSKFVTSDLYSVGLVAIVVLGT